MEKKDSEKLETESRRCKWCGIPISEIGRGWKNEYCSSDCEAAQNPSAWKMVALLEIVYFPVLAIAFYYSWFFAIILAIVLHYLIIVMYRINQETAVEAQKQRPKNSRRYEVVPLKKTHNVAKCHACGGHIDLKSLDPSKVFECEYCGAMGVIRIKNE